MVAAKSSTQKIFPTIWLSQPQVIFTMIQTPPDSTPLAYFAQEVIITLINSPLQFSGVLSNLTTMLK